MTNRANQNWPEGTAVEVPWTDLADWRINRLFPVVDRLRQHKDEQYANDINRAMRQACIRLMASDNPQDVQFAEITLDSLYTPKVNPYIHSTDKDCHVDPETGCCKECNVFHGDPCPECGNRGFHSPNCAEIG